MSRRGLLALCLLLTACKRNASAPETGDAGPPEVSSVKAPAANASPAEGADVASRPVQPLAVCRAQGSSPLDAARGYYDGGRFEEALSCAAQAAALEPDLAAAHAERGVALAALGREPEAQLAFARALAIDPGDSDALLGAAHLYAVQLPSTRERDELGTLYAERGLSQPGTPPELIPHLALVAAMAFNDLGQSEEALARAAIVLAREPGSREALYERALALFELCRFAEAKVAFQGLVSDAERAAHAHQHLGLLLEREGKWKQAQVHFDKARSLAPEDFPTPPLPGEDAFRVDVARAVSELPVDMRGDLEGVPVTAEELPAEGDLLANQPPLSPTILGLFRGPPLGAPCDGTETPCRSVVLYRRNLARAVRTPAELREQIRVTLLHEIGHLRGEDDEELAARGLE
ncbi:metallopeptidase family protein [Myxococcus sp. CA051A]|uniref:Tetratricopeptide repeat protein n=1 Tax=Myxococcus llanfairpwllgwyngyllgogerychwyrndrobwllllantysiliogogogochensis TaxID=2590453 RepID=A0A540WKX8_9BACT|nr:MULTISPECIES: metallopeptidase family protein [Myxococcus]NTX07146.1 metallopeptidase family protein [Myxococcus sp. CA040A]NTX57162.1 metallopeptidase family protein [Myxococcus sp. CA039A]NTX66526.1 metallopeptidase family protein [Myxococcus sp. CA051A]TQF09673.1 tetratricopeptide repeat protein [Myxococcus llanfairpwllgwyngyllgogerychwyrndrobwllllantysiliogogogochensis]